MTRDAVIDDKCNHSRLVFFLAENICREKEYSSKTIRGTQRMHHVRSVAPGMVAFKNLTCSCGPCLMDCPYEDCKNQQHTEPWKKVSLHRVTRRQTGSSSMSNQRNRNRLSVGRSIPVEMPRQVSGPEVHVASAHRPDSRSLDEPVHDNTPVRDEQRKMPVVVTNSSENVENMANAMSEPTDADKKKKGGEHTRLVSSPVHFVQEQVFHYDIDHFVPKMTSEMKSEDNRAMYYKGVLDILRAATCYPQLEELVQICHSNIGDDPINVHERYIEDMAVPLDELSMQVLPDDMPVTEHGQVYPISVIGDGNCLPRTGSIFAYGTEEHHEEIRAKIIMEQVLHK